MKHLFHISIGMDTFYEIRARTTSVACSQSGNQHRKCPEAEVESRSRSPLRKWETKKMAHTVNLHVSTSFPRQLRRAAWKLQTSARARSTGWSGIENSIIYYYTFEYLKLQFPPALCECFPVFYFHDGRISYNGRMTHFFCIHRMPICVIYVSVHKKNYSPILWNAWHLSEWFMVLIFRWRT